MAVWEPPDYRKLYDEQCLKIQMLQCKNDQLRETLRDQFAMAIISGFAGNNAIFAANPMSGWSLVNCETDQLCATAYGMADAMMEAREAK